MRCKARQGTSREPTPVARLPAEATALLFPARRKWPLQLLQDQALIRAAREDPLDDIRRQQREPQDPASVIGPVVSIPHVLLLRRGAGLLLLSVVDARPPHDAVRWSGRANLTCVVPRIAGHHRIHGFTRPMRPRDGTSFAGSRSHLSLVRRQHRALLGCPSETPCHPATCGAVPRRACGRAPLWPSSCRADCRRVVPMP
jgi:hypothetical protein